MCGSWHFFRNFEKFIQIQQILKMRLCIGCLGMFVCQAGLALTILNWSPIHWIFLEVHFLWAPLVRFVRIVKCLHYLPAGSFTPGYSSKAFIYSLTNDNGSGRHAVYNPVKLRVKLDKYCRYWATSSLGSSGPRFGWSDIVISNNANSNQDSVTYCGEKYPLPPGYSLYDSRCNFYAGSYRFTPTDIEVFYETTT